MARPLGNDLELGQIVGRKETLTLSREARATHLYVCGATGTGKSKFLENLLRQDIINWRKDKCGMLLIDPHGALYDNLMAWLAWHDIKRPIIPIDLSQKDDSVISYNLLRHRPGANSSVIVDNIVQAMAYVWGQTNTDATPLFARWMSNILQALYEKKHTLVEAVHLTDRMRGDLREALTQGLTDQMAARDWEFANRILKPKEFDEQISSTVNRLQRFLRNDYLRCILGQPDVSLDLGRALEKGSIILVNLSREKANISKEDGDLFATLLLNDLWTAAQERGKRKGIKPFYVYIDEFQKFVTPSIAENLDEARGFGLHLTLAHQFPQQLIDTGEHGKRLYNSVMENARSKVVFQLSVEENLKPLAQILFRSVMDPDKVKLELYSTKVMEYREEYRTAYSKSVSKGEGQGSHIGHAESQGMDPTLEVWQSRFSDSSLEGTTFSSGSSESESRFPVLLPVLGQELAHVQFSDLDEQLFRAMAVLFDQQQRQFVTRLVGMKAPASVFTPFVKEAISKPERIERYIKLLLENLNFVKPIKKVREEIKERERYFSEQYVRETFKEPATSKRRKKTP
jgi:hypothetical protein